MAVEQPEHPLRAMGQAVEDEFGHTNEQLAELRQKMSRTLPALKKQTYDATKFTDEHNKHKCLMNSRFLAYVSQVHDDPADLPGFVAILDDFDEHGTLRTTEALTADLGVPAHRIISPNRSAVVVEALKAKGVLSEVGNFNKVMYKRFCNHQIAAAYLDMTTGDKVAVEMAVDTVVGQSEYNPVCLATTLVERNFSDFMILSREHVRRL